MRRSGEQQSNRRRGRRQNRDGDGQGQAEADEAFEEGKPPQPANEAGWEAGQQTTEEADDK
jgi:hypothetical protein